MRLKYLVLFAAILGSSCRVVGAPNYPASSRSGLSEPTGAVRLALDEYYAAIPVASFEDFPPYAEARDPLLCMGRPVILAILDDLESQRVSVKIKRKALFALGGFFERDAVECEGSVIETLVSLTGSSDRELSGWSEVALGEGLDLPLSGAKAWRSWWVTEGRSRYPKLCE